VSLGKPRRCGERLQNGEQSAGVGSFSVHKALGLLQDEGRRNQSGVRAPASNPMFEMRKPKSERMTGVESGPA
jgi:hypothetical protein